MTIRAPDVEVVGTTFPAHSLTNNIQGWVHRAFGTLAYPPTLKFHFLLVFARKSDYGEGYIEKAQDSVTCSFPHDLYRSLWTAVKLKRLYF